MSVMTITHIITLDFLSMSILYYAFQGLPKKDIFGTIAKWQIQY